MAEPSDKNRDKELLYECVLYAQNTDELTKILQCIPLKVVQNMIQKQINEMDPMEAKYCLYHSTPIDSILPECIIQYILSFNYINEAKLVNTKWKQYSEKNEEIFIKKTLQNIIADKYDKNLNKTWIIHPNRKKLYQWEQELFPHAIVKTTTDMETAQYGCRIGDRILFHNGIYTHSCCNQAAIIRRGVHVIGIGDNVIFKDQFIGDKHHQRSFVKIEGRASGYGYQSEYFNNKNFQTLGTFVENIKFDCRNTYSYKKFGHITVARLSEFVIRNCIIQGNNNGNGIVAYRETQLNVEHCRFIDYGEGSTAVAIDERSERASVQKCVFLNCGDESDCISTFQSWNSFRVNYVNEEWNFNSTMSVKLSICDNIFTKEYCKLEVADFVFMIEGWMKENKLLSKKLARKKLITKFGVSDQTIKSDIRFKQAIEIVQCKIFC